MTTMLIAFNGTRDNGQFMGDQLCYIKAAYAFVENTPCDKILLALSPLNEMHFLWQKFIDVNNCEVVYDMFCPGDNEQRWQVWDKWRKERHIEGRKFDHYRELYLRIHGAQRQKVLCGSERGLGRKNIYEYLLYGQEDKSDGPVKGCDWFDDTLIYHPTYIPDRDVYISPHCKTQGNATFTFAYWAEVVHKLIDAGISVTVGYNGSFCDDLPDTPLYKKYWGDHKQWLDQVCRHKIVACGNTGTGWLAAACGIPLFTMEPPNSVMADHRYRECGLKGIVEVMDTPDADYCAKRLIAEVNRKIVMTTGCYDVLHAGHIRHLEKSRALGTHLVVALNSDASVRKLKGDSRPINNQEQRKTVLQALRCVDEVRIFDGENALELIKTVKPCVLTNGFGYKVAQIVGKDLVEGYGGCVVVTCHGDASNEPSTTKIVAKLCDINEVCRIAGSVSLNPYTKLKLMADQFVSVLNLPGAVADVGAYRGGTSLILRRLAPAKELHLFDTWSGNPFDEDLCHHKKGEWPAKLAECQKLVGDALYHEGVFPETACGEEFCFVYVDPDTYQTVRDAIAYFWPRMVPGGKMFFDDYGWDPCSGVKKAVDEALSDVTVYAPYSCVAVKYV